MAKHARAALSAAALLMGLVCALAAQDTAPLGSSPLVKEHAPRVQAAPVTTVVKVSPGKATKFSLSFRVPPGYHINSHAPSSDLLIPTEVHLNPPTDIYVGTTYPPGRDLRFKFAPGEKFNVYTGDFALATLVRAASKAPLGTYRVHGELKYQACDDRACYPPGIVPIAFDVRVVKPAKPHARRRYPTSPNIR